MCFVSATEKMLNGKLIFEVDNNLFKGRLLADFQIKTTASNRELVRLVEQYFSKWMAQIELVLNEGRQITEQPDDVGPRHELQHWRHILAKYTSAAEFVESKAFKHHLECLTLSRCKLVKKWRIINEQLVMALNVAKDNVEYLMSLGRFFEPLYRSDPVAMIKCLPILMKTLENVYISSKFYNTSDCMAAFLVKCTNQLIIVCRNFITENGSRSVFNYPPKTLEQKVQVSSTILPVCIMMVI